MLEYRYLFQSVGLKLMRQIRYFCVRKVEGCVNVSEHLGRVLLISLGKFHEDIVALCREINYTIFILRGRGRVVNFSTE